MKLFFQIVYNIIIIPLFWIVLKLLQFKNEKIKRGIEGRKNMFSLLQKQMSFLNKSEKIILFHSSSLGEFEQAKPIIKLLKKKIPNLNIVVSFFSPSGFENVKKNDFDFKTYLPFDTKNNAKNFLDILNPNIVIFLTYDIWPNLVWELKRRNTNMVVINSRLRQKNFFAKLFYKIVFNELNFIYTISEYTKNDFVENKILFPKIYTVGDTRFDQIKLRSESDSQIISSKIIEQKNILTIGSSYEKDEKIVLNPILKLSNEIENFLCFIVPHEPTQKNIFRIEKFFSQKKNTIRVSKLEKYNGEKIIIVDSIGILFSLYKFSNLVFIGGSFKKNIHNVVEPAIFSCPIICGPKFQNSIEAIDLVSLKGIIVVRNEDEFYNYSKSILLNRNLQNEIGKISKNYVEEKLGATKIILEKITELLQ